MRSNSWGDGCHHKFKQMRLYAMFDQGRREREDEEVKDQVLCYA